MPIERLLIHPTCVNLNEELMQQLNAEYERVKKAIAFDGIEEVKGRAQRLSKAFKQFDMRANEAYRSCSKEIARVLLWHG